MKHVLRFCLGGFIYIMIETLWRAAVNHRPTHITMFFLAGFVVATILYHEDRGCNIFITSLYGMITTTIGELIIGLISVDIFNTRLWEYGGITYRGIISLKWSLLWYVACLTTVMIYRKTRKHV